MAGSSFVLIPTRSASPATSTHSSGIRTILYFNEELPQLRTITFTDPGSDFITAPPECRHANVPQRDTSLTKGRAFKFVKTDSPILRNFRTSAEPDGGNMQFTANIRPFGYNAFPAFSVRAETVFTQYFKQRQNKWIIHM